MKKWISFFVFFIFLLFNYQVRAQTILAKIGNYMALPGERIKIAIEVGSMDGRNVFGATGFVQVDSSVVNPLGVSVENTLLQEQVLLKNDFLVSYNSGNIATAAFQILSRDTLKGEGVFIDLVCEVTGQVGDTSHIGLTFFFNSGSPPTNNMNGFIRIVNVTHARGLNLLPNDFGLKQNYPNPFNPETNIEYFLSEPGRVRLQIFDILGREVNTLINTFQNIGEYSIKWDGTNSFGVPVSSGLYVYKMEAGRQVFIKKMTLIK